MIEYLRSTKNSPTIKKMDKISPGSWVRLETPTDEELSEITKSLKLNEEIVNDVIDPHEVPRIEVEDGKIYFITRAPSIDDKHNEFTKPIMFVVGKSYIATVSKDNLEKLWQPILKSNDCSTTQQTKLFLIMMETIVLQYQKHMDTINKQMRKVINNITRLRPKDITIFVEYERKLNDYMDALIPTNVALEKFLSGRYVRLYEDDLELTEDLSIDAEQLIVRCKSMLRTITNVRDSYRAIMDTQLNDTIRLLTVITVALTIPTMIAGLYGMNVDIPGNIEDPKYFFIITAVSLFSAFGISYYFLKRR